MTWEKVICICLVASVGLCFLGCSETPEKPEEEPDIADNIPDDDMTHISSDIVIIPDDEPFDFRIFLQLINQEGMGKNVFISPTSIAIALAMTYNGARGETQQAMAEVLGLEGMTLQQVNQCNASLIAALGSLDGNVQLDIANSLWAREGVEFQPDFMKRNEDFYRAEVTNLDFGEPGAPDIINSWVSKQTQGKIDSIIDRIDAGVILFLIDAIYFRGNWTVEFDKEKTYEDDFTRIDGSRKRVPMMVSRSDYMHYWNERFQAISLPYGSGRISMYIFLPDRGFSLQEFYRSLNERNWSLWMSQFREEEVEVCLPRFRLEYDIKLNDAFIALGMGIAFAPGADFTGMCADSPWIDEVKHKTFVEVNEEGTEAAAATAVVMKLGGIMEMVVDRPFFCTIRDNRTGAMLFMGSIVDP